MKIRKLLAPIAFVGGVIAATVVGVVIRNGRIANEPVAIEDTDMQEDSESFDEFEEVETPEKE